MSENWNILLWVLLIKYIIKIIKYLQKLAFKKFFEILNKNFNFSLYILYIKNYY